MMQLRPYQEEAIGRVLEEWDKGVKKTLLVLPTGTGKTICFSKIVEEQVRNGDRVLILAHRGELLDQAADKLKKSTGLNVAIEKAEETALNKWERVTVGSIQSLSQDKRLSNFKSDYYQSIVVDEAHHILSSSYLKVLNHFSDANVLGVTATADRGDMQNLGKYFETLAYEYTMPDAIHDGYLSPIKALQIPLKIDISSVKQSQGDFQVSGIGHALDPYLDEIANQMLTYCKERKTVVFLPLVSTSKKFSELLNQKGLRAAEVNGNSKDRSEVLQDFQNGKYDVLCNAMLLTEGWDCPSVDTIIVLRPTKVRSLYTQMVGRGTRIAPGKDHLLILDFLWQTQEHSLCRPAVLISKDEAIQQKAKQMMDENQGKEMDVEELVDDAETSVAEEREQALAERLKALRTKKKRLVDPLEYAVSVQKSSLIDYRPAFGWEAEKPSYNQIETLIDLDINADSLENAGQAAILIDTIRGRKDGGLSTPKQIRLLERYGFQHVGTWSLDQASKMIGRISQSGWRVPRSISAKTYKPEA